MIRQHAGILWTKSFPTRKRKEKRHITINKLIKQERHCSSEAVKLLRDRWVKRSHSLFSAALSHKGGKKTTNNANNLFLMHWCSWKKLSLLHLYWFWSLRLIILQLLLWDERRDYCSSHGPHPLGSPETAPVLLNFWKRWNSYSLGRCCLRVFTSGLERSHDRAQ